MYIYSLLKIKGVTLWNFITEHFNILHHKGKKVIMFDHAHCINLVHFITDEAPPTLIYHAAVCPSVSASPFHLHIYSTVTSHKRLPGFRPHGL